MAKATGSTEPSRPTVKRLFAVSGNMCAFPDCGRPLVDPTSGSILGEVCHIKGEKPDAARYDSSQTDLQRHGFGNLILLCRAHHKIIDDNPQEHPVEKLKEWKASHEARCKEIPVDKEATNRFVSYVTLNVIQKGPVVTSQNQTGGQIAHNITNLYQTLPVISPPSSDKSRTACYLLIDYLDAWYEDRHGRSNSPTVANSPWKAHLDYLDAVWQPGPTFSQLPNELQNRDVVLTCHKHGLLDYGEVGTTPPEAYGEEAEWWHCRPLRLTKAGRDFAAEYRLSGSMVSDRSRQPRSPLSDLAREHGQENGGATLSLPLTPECYQLLAMVVDAQEPVQIREMPKPLTGDPMSVCEYYCYVERFNPLIEDAERRAKERKDGYVVGPLLRSTISSEPTHVRITKKGRACLAIHRLASKSMSADKEAKNSPVVVQQVVDAISEVYSMLDRLFEAASDYLHPAGDKELHFNAYREAGRAFEECFLRNRLFMPDGLFRKVNDAYRRLSPN